MILDTLKNAELYESAHPLFKKAFDFLKTTDLKTLPLGKIELEGSDLVVSVVDISGKTVQDARMEIHRKFIDIQLPLDGEEIMGWIPAEKLTKVLQPYDAEKDIAFFADEAENLVKVRAMEFAVFFPSDGHQPGIGFGNHKKIIVKVRV
ncbi:MAG TPA: YhcH/YjgK/YiaL family protein [Paludibacteraceae bacterium]|jgi:YhcH/YjgK/YiaL family protein|nr:YhcH/YjgK/YiaL family protein [Paludibacteraceae bacterium]HPQ13327.1 YhcH/YjgK/YiaL family protein [Paludibacteraceae bacterium]